MTDTTLWRGVGWSAVVLFALIAVVMLAVGWVHDGIAAPDLQCLHGPFPEQGGPFYESTELSGAVSLFPLGVDCTYDVPGDAFGPQTVHNYNLGPTIVLVVSVLGVGAGVWMLARTRAATERSF